MGWTGIGLGARGRFRARVDLRATGLCVWLRVTEISEAMIARWEGITARKSIVDIGIKKGYTTRSYFNAAAKPSSSWNRADRDLES